MLVVHSCLGLTGEKDTVLWGRKQDWLCLLSTRAAKKELALMRGDDQDSSDDNLVLRFVP